MLLFLAAAVASLREARHVWRDSSDPLIGALALGAGIGVLMLLAKGMVEPMFEQFKLATLLGLLLGTIVAAARSRPEPPCVDDLEKEPSVRAVPAVPAGLAHPG